MTRHFDATEVDALGYCVYVYTDPRNDSSFCVGKGKGNRAFAHLSDASELEKVARIAEIRTTGIEPRIEVLAFGLDERTAFKVEAAAIDLIGFENLTNRVSGHGAREFGRRSIDAIHAELAAPSLTKFHHNVAIIRIGASVELAKTCLGVRFDGALGESAMVLYAATRGARVISQRRADAVQYLLAYCMGVIREVYEPAIWLPAGSTPYTDGAFRDEAPRLEFVGRIADESVRKLYRLKKASHLFKQGDVNPVRFFGER